MTNSQASQVRGLAAEYLAGAPELHVCQLIDEMDNKNPVATNMVVDKISDLVFGTDFESIVPKVENYISIRGYVDYEVMQWAVRRVRKLIAR